jgi:hypothetical protein
MFARRPKEVSGCWRRPYTPMQKNAPPADDDPFAVRARRVGENMPATFRTLEHFPIRLTRNRVMAGPSAGHPRLTQRQVRRGCAGHQGVSRPSSTGYARA